MEKWDSVGETAWWNSNGGREWCNSEIVMWDSVSGTMEQ